MGKAMDFSKIDKNFLINKKVDTETVVFRSCTDESFSLFGVFHDGEGLCRMPKEAASAVSPSILTMFRQPAGGRLRFKTNSPYIALMVKTPGISKYSNIALSMSCGFDIYVGGRFDKNLTPDPKDEKDFLAVRDYGGFWEKDVTVYLPLFNDVTELYVGLHKDATVSPGAGYSGTELPVVFYGSSITHGACASRPSMAYEALLSKMLDIDFVNLGFAGSAKGEEKMAEYISGLDMSVFVYDYDHNAPNAEHLRKTHKRFFDIVRAKNPDLPIIMITRPSLRTDEGIISHQKEILNTYNQALEDGDRNVYYIDGQRLFDGYCTDDCLVDGTHPGDLGFMCMARSIAPVLEKVISDLKERGKNE